MKTSITTFLVAAALMSLTSCKKESFNDNGGLNSQVTTSTGTNYSYDDLSGTGCPTATTPLIAGQHIDAGTVSVTNDEEYIYVTYTTANGYLLTETHLYVGDCEALPVNNKGNAAPGQFPYKATHNAAGTYTVQVPIAAIPAGTCGCIAAHASVVKYGYNGQVIDSQTGWGSGTLVNPTSGNWAMKFQYCSCGGRQ